MRAYSPIILLDLTPTRQPDGDGQVSAQHEQQRSIRPDSSGAGISGCSTWVEGRVEGEGVSSFNFPHLATCWKYHSMSQGGLETRRRRVSRMPREGAARVRFMA